MSSTPRTHTFSMLIKVHFPKKPGIARISVVNHSVMHLSSILVCSLSSEVSAENIWAVIHNSVTSNRPKITLNSNSKSSVSP